MPDRLPLLDKVTPVGNALAVVQVNDAGLPLAVSENEFDVPAVKVVLLPLETVADSSTVRVNDCVAAVPTPLPASKVSE